jgi:hypothetical protein
MSKAQVAAEFASSHGARTTAGSRSVDAENGGPRSKKTYEYRGPRSLAAGQFPLLSR